MRPKNDKTEMEMFAKNLSNQLEKSDTSKRELARHLGIYESNITKYCQGKFLPSRQNIMKIAAFFDCEIQALFR